MTNQGWVLHWRKMEDWEWYKTPNMTHLFMHLISRANHKEKQWQGQTIQRGQLITSLESLKTQTGLSIQTIRTCLSRLKSTGEIEQKATNRYRLITICNYETYQNHQHASNKPPNKQVTNKQQTTNKQLTTNNNDNNVNHYNNEKNIRTFTQQQCIDVGIMLGMEVVRSVEFFNHYNAQGWVFGNGQPVRDLRSAMTKWRANQYRFEKPTRRESAQEQWDRIQKEKKK